jgi:hypothetical protein
MYEMPTMQAWQRLHDEGKLDPVRDRFFGRKPAEELYDTEADPWEVKNLAEDPAHAATLARLRAELRRWQLEIRDLGVLPEADLRSRFGAEAPYDAVRRGPSPLERVLDAAEAASRGTPPALDDADPAVRTWGVLGRRIRGEKGAADALRPLLKDPAAFVRLAAAEVLVSWGDASAVAVLAEGLASPEEPVRLQAAQALDDHAKAQPAAREALRKVDPKTAGEYVRRLVEHVQ